MALTHCGVLGKRRGDDGMVRGRGQLSPVGLSSSMPGRGLGGAGTASADAIVTLKEANPTAGSRASVRRKERGGREGRCRWACWAWSGAPALAGKRGGGRGCRCARGPEARRQPKRERGGKEERAAPVGQKERVREFEPAMFLPVMNCISFSMLLNALLI
jgi:hypothetical protein